MTSKIDLILSLQQIENISKLMRGNKYERFVTSHLLPIKFELERQIALHNYGKKVV
jgi:hypothetical protein